MKIKSIYLENVKNLNNITVSFGPKLNIITGINGTGKSTILNCLINGINRAYIDPLVTKNPINRIIINVDRGSPGSECVFENNNKVSSVVPPEETPILAFNPKRNISREEFQNILQRTMTQSERAKYGKEMASHFDNGVYNEIISIGEILSLKMRELPIDKTPEKYNSTIVAEFNLLASKIFPSLKMTHIDYINISQYKFIFENHGKKVDLNDLSTGEKEVLTLLMNIYFYKDNFKILLIDEPEVHLNWDLESKLFKILLNFSQVEDKQIILTTHSRVLLEYLEHGDVNFINLYLDQDSSEVKINNQNFIQELEEIIGKVTIFDKYEKIIVCEDDLHKKVLEMVNEEKVYAGKIKIVPLGDKGNVVKFIDGLGRFPSLDFKNKFYGYVDLDGDIINTNPQIKTISKYGIENYFLQSNILFNLDQSKSRKFSDQQGLESFVVQVFENEYNENLGSFNQAVMDSKKVKKIIPHIRKYLGFETDEVFFESYCMSILNTNLFDEFKIIV